MAFGLNSPDVWLAEEVLRLTGSSLRLAKMGFFRRLTFQACCKELDAFDKTGVCAQHHHFDGIEVPFTPETPCQVGFPHRGRLEFSAKRTKKAEEPLALLAGERQFFFDERVDGYEISQLIKLPGRKPPFHLVTPPFTGIVLGATRYEGCIPMAP